MSMESVERCDISVVITAHAEGRLAHRTIRSVQATVDEAKLQGLRIEIIVSLNRPTSETRAYFKRGNENAQVLESSHEEPGIGLNEAISLARGKYIALVDAETLLGKTWLSLAHARAEQSQLADFIVHPEYTIYFDKWNLWTRHVPSSAPGFKRIDLLDESPWTSSFLAPKSTYQRIPFLTGQPSSDFIGDYSHWICNVLAAGGEVVTAAGTCNFVRQQPQGWQRSTKDVPTRLIFSSDIFDPRTLFKSDLRRTAPHERAAENQDSSVSKVIDNRSLRERVRAIPKDISRATESYPRLQKTLGAVYRTVIRKPDVNELLPDWLLEQWREISEIEPAYFPSRKLLAQMEHYEYSVQPWVAVYEKLCCELACYDTEVPGPQFTHVYLVPRLKRGGTDRVTINFVLLTASNPANRVLVIATDEPDSPWKVRLPDNVAFLNFCEPSRHLAREQKKTLLANLLVQLRPQVIHNIYSLLGNQVYALYARGLSQIARLYAPAYCIELESDGKPVGEIISFLPGHAEHLTAVISDNQHILNWLEEKFALDPAKLFVHYQPVTLKGLSKRRKRKPDDPYHVLWAGRLDRQKHPEIMVEIARRCQSDNIHFHVYGSNVVAVDKAKVDFSNSPNITYHGEFDGLSSIPTQEYDVFLNTSEWEGMPNILLEAVGEGLPIVASDVGGVRELIIQDETGLIVFPFDDVGQYVQALRRLKADPELSERFMLASRRLVAERHSWQHFADELNRLPGYLKNPCQLERAELSRLDLPIPPLGK